MKRVILAGVSAIAVVTMMSAANAADLPRRHAAMPVKAPEYMAAYNWTGAYVGINGGGAWGRSNWSSAGTDFNTSGGLVGGTIGYNWQTGPAVFGLEGDIDWSGIKGSGTCGALLLRDQERLARHRARPHRLRVRPRDAVRHRRSGGRQRQGVGAPLGSNDETRAGWTLGGGIEANIVGPWSAKLEYLYADLGKTNCSTCVAGGTDVSFHEQHRARGPQLPLLSASHDETA